MKSTNETSNLLYTINDMPLVLIKMDKTRVVIKKDLPNNAKLIYDALFRHFKKNSLGLYQEYRAPKLKDIAELLKSHKHVRFENVKNLLAFVDNHTRNLRDHQLFVLKRKKFENEFRNSAKISKDVNVNELLSKLESSFVSSIKDLKMKITTKEELEERIVQRLDAILIETCKEMGIKFHRSFSIKSYIELTPILVKKKQRNYLKTLSLLSKSDKDAIKKSFLESKTRNQLLQEISLPSIVLNVFPSLLKVDFLFLSSFWEEVLQVVVSNLDSIDRKLAHDIIDLSYEILEHEREIKDHSKIDVMLEIEIKSFEQDIREFFERFQKTHQGERSLPYLTRLLDEARRYYQVLFGEEKIDHLKFNNSTLRYNLRAFYLIQSILHEFPRNHEKFSEALQEINDLIKLIQENTDIMPTLTFMQIFLESLMEALNMEGPPVSEEQLLANLSLRCSMFIEQFPNHLLAFQVRNIENYIGFIIYFQKFLDRSEKLTFIDVTNYSELGKMVSILKRLIKYIRSIDAGFMEKNVAFGLFLFLFSEQCKHEASHEMFKFIKTAYFDEKLIEFEDFKEKIGEPILRSLVLLQFSLNMLKQLESRSGIKIIDDIQLNEDELEKTIICLQSILADYGDDTVRKRDFYDNMFSELDDLISSEEKFGEFADFHATCKKEFIDSLFKKFGKPLMQNIISLIPAVMFQHENAEQLQELIDSLSNFQFFIWLFSERILLAFSISEISTDFVKALEKGEIEFVEDDEKR
ncbi:MAG: hypothetical protein ACXQS8_01150 [Candidatus Helarchaeales archaeon]